MLFPGSGPNDGEVLSPLAGEFRLFSDFELARDERTACEWQSMVANQQLMMNNFKSAMEKLAIVGHNARDLIDCSDLIPAAKAPVSKAATFPAGTGRQDVQQACPSPFPVLKTDGTSMTFL